MKKNKESQLQPEKGYRYLTMAQAAEIVGGRVCGNEDYPLYGMTAIGSAKEFELCVVLNDEDLAKLLRSDAEAILTDEEHELVLEHNLNTQIIVVKDVRAAAIRLSEVFSSL